MHSFFQSPLRKDIKTIIYGEQSFTINLFDQEYFGIIKKKSVGPLSLSWFQVLGVEIPFHDIDWIQAETHKIQHDYGHSRQHILFQLGITNQITQFDNHSSYSPDFVDGLIRARHHIHNKLLSCHLVPSFRENMPLSTIQINLQQEDDNLLNDMIGGTQKNIKRASKLGLEWVRGDQSDYIPFYESRSKIAQIKNFNIISQYHFLELIHYLHTTDSGDIFLAKKDGEILGGSVILYHDNKLYYLYGFANRNEPYRNVGVHHWIKFEIFKRARAQGYEIFDLFGGAPTGYPDHSLVHVSKFKESLGGKKIERFGNFDIVLNKPLYTLFQYHHKRKKS